MKPTYILAIVITSILFFIFIGLIYFCFKYYINKRAANGKGKYKLQRLGHPIIIIIVLSVVSLFSYYIVNETIYNYKHNSFTVEVSDTLDDIDFEMLYKEIYKKSRAETELLANAKENNNLEIVWYLDPSDIMGIFRFLPMECRHEIVSMRHSLYGSLVTDNMEYNFNGGIGYIEGDSGRSFPRQYLWLHSNDFSNGSSYTLSVAEIPFCGLHFQGVICVVMVGKKEYRLATYLGGMATLGKNWVVIRQNPLVLKAEIISKGRTGGSLASPQNGKMSGMIKEHNDASIRLTLHDKGSLICDLYSNRAAYERYPN